MSLSVLVVDDEPPAREFLKRLLGRMEGVTVIGEAENGEEALQQVDEQHPEVVFLDIQMPEMSGLEVAQALQMVEAPPWVVFATGYDEYAVQAFEAAAIDYIMKPYDEERLEKTIDRIRKLQSEGGGAEERARIHEEIARMAPRITKLPVKIEDTIHLIDPADILFVQARGRRVYVKTRTSEIPTNLTVTQFEQRLGGHNFFRANEGCLVNLDRVREIAYKGERNYELKLNDKEGTTVELSRSRSRALRAMVRDLL